ncbi:MAG TPA: N-acetyltransferase DgcN [Pseudomonadales bacterium]
MRSPNDMASAGTRIEAPYLIFLGSAHDQLAAKTGQGIVDWRPQNCIGQLRLPECQADLGLPDLSVAEAAAAGARTLVIGTVSPGGSLPEKWLPILHAALANGLDIASGMHDRLDSFPEIRDAAARHDRRLVDVRHSTVRFPTGSGRKRSGRRLLTVGTDCSVGKKYAALALEREMRSRGMDAEFRATGQTGILIAGSGVAIDAVTADFISGAAECLTPDAERGHWDVVEGQGSIFHPSFAGVSLGLLHGTQPDAVVVCHEPTRRTMRNVSTLMPRIGEVIEQTLVHGRTTNPDVVCIGVAVNTAALDEGEARELLTNYAAQLGLPVTDPIRFGAGLLVDELVKNFPD